MDPSESGILNITSKSQFFSSNSSRLGSLESSVIERPNSEELRPNLGLGKIVSPEKEPIKMLEAALNKTFSKEETRDIKSIIRKGADPEKLKSYFKKIIEKKDSQREETVVLDAVTSFLEATTLDVSQNLTFGKGEKSNLTDLYKRQRHSSPVKLLQPQKNKTISNSKISPRSRIPKPVSPAASQTAARPSIAAIIRGSVKDKVTQIQGKDVTVLSYSLQL